MRIYYRFRRGLVSLLVLFLIGLMFSSVKVKAGQETINDTTHFKSQFYNQNEKCFRCHGNSKYTYHNKLNNKEVAAMMFDKRIIHRDAFYSSNHKSFACTDCHSADYDTFPHPGELRMEDPYNCIDCHGNDEKFARFHFEEIESEFKQSTHYKAVGDAFTCWKCHNPHTYKINIRDSKNITRSIAYDNQICLNCHSDFERFQLLTDRKEINIIQKHEWLPNQALHFSQVRCIECHARINDSLLVSHRIMPKDKAVKRCVECHSQNSILMSSLYKYKAKENRTHAGFLNAIILNNAFVIGANRNVMLNKVSIIVFSIMIILLIIHFILSRILKKKG
jgi:hypothetical protein